MGVIRKKNEDLKAIVDKEEYRVRGMLSAMETLKAEHEGNINFKDIIELQLKKEKKYVGKEVVKVMKNKNLVKAVFDKENVVISGKKEKNITCKSRGEKEELKSGNKSVKVKSCY